MPNKIICLIAFVISFTVSIFNWINSGIDVGIEIGIESFSNFYAYNNIMHTEGLTLTNALALDLALSQLSSILNVFMLLGVNTIYLIVNKKDKKTIKGSIINLIWTIIDFACIIIPIIFIMLTFSKVPDICRSAICLNCITYFIIASQLGIFTMIPLIVYLTTIVLSFVDMLINEHIIDDKRSKLIKILLLIFLGLSFISIAVSWHLASPLNSPFNMKEYCDVCV